MKKFIKYINEYASLLEESAVWHNSNEILAPIIADTDTAADDYIYEFYCYISLIIDLMSNYEIAFVKGVDKFEYKFPQKAALKKGKPRFHAYEKGLLSFQICAGTKINCSIASEDNHPDISFQRGSASENPCETDLIVIMDAKFKEKAEADLPKTEVYKFGFIVSNLYKLHHPPTVNIRFNRFSSLFGNCLITNGGSYCTSSDVSLLRSVNIKEVENFAPGLTHNVLG